jgi:hypothetical protein
LAASCFRQAFPARHQNRGKTCFLHAQLYRIPRPSATQGKNPAGKHGEPLASGQGANAEIARTAESRKMEASAFAASIIFFKNVPK